MIPLETDNSLRVKIGYLETRNAYEHYDLTSQVEALQKQVERLEAELEERPVVWAIQHIKEKRLVKRFGAVMLFQTKEDVDGYIPTGFIYPFEWHAVVYKGEARWFNNGISNGEWKSLTANGSYRQ